MDVKLKIPRSIAYVLTHAQYNHVTNLRGAPGDQNRDIHLTFSGPRLQCSYRRYIMITKPRSASQSSAIIYDSQNVDYYDTMLIGVSVSEPPSSDVNGTFFYIIYIYIYYVLYAVPHILNLSNLMHVTSIRYV